MQNAKGHQDLAGLAGTNYMVARGKLASANVRLYVSLAFAVCCLVGGLVFLLASGATRALRGEVQSNLDTASEQLAVELNELLQGASNDTKYVAAARPLQSVLAGDTGDFELLAQGLVDGSSQYAAVFVADQSGEVRALIAAEEAGPIVGDSLSKQAWFQATLEAREGAVVWIEPGALSLGKQGSKELFGFAAPLIDSDGRVSGVAVCVSFLSSARRVLEPYSPQGGQAWAEITGARSGTVLVSSATRDAAYTFSAHEIVGEKTKRAVWRASVYQRSQSVIALEKRNRFLALGGVAVLLALLGTWVISALRVTTSAELVLDATTVKLMECQALSEDSDEFRMELQLKCGEMERVFNNVNVGFISLDKNGVMAVERSSCVDAWFGTFDQPALFADYMRASNADYADIFELAWESLSEGLLPLELCLYQLPEQFKVGERHYALHYTLVPAAASAGDEEAWHGVIVEIRDVSEEKHAERVHAEERELGNAIKAITKDGAGYATFHNETAKLIEQILAPNAQAELSQLKRAVHTVKGNVGIYGFHTIAEHCHAMEEELNGPEGLSNDTVAELGSRWGRLDDAVQMILGTGREEITISAEHYQELLGRLHTMGGDIFQEVFAWQLEPIQVALGRLAQRTRSVASRMGLPNLQVIADGSDLGVDPKFWSPFWRELVHVLRNSLDHGLSAESQKDPTLTLSGHISGNEFVFEVADNGAGIDWKKVATKAAETGLPSARHEDLIQALFVDGLTTRDAATQISGRGLGLSAVKEQVVRMGGRIHVESSLGHGTTFQFFFPERLLYGELYEATCSALGQGEAHSGAQGVCRALEAHVDATQVA